MCRERKHAEQSAPSKVEVIQRTIDDDVQFYYWLIVTANFKIDEQAVHKTLLWKIVELYVSVQGFALANGWVEKYKQRTKAATQKAFVETYMIGPNYEMLNMCFFCT